MAMQVFDSAEHLAHDIGSEAFRESLRSNDTIEEFASTAVLHHDVDIAIIDVTLIKFDNIRMINCLQNGEFFLKQADILSDTLTKD